MNVQLGLYQLVDRQRWRPPRRHRRREPLSWLTSPREVRSGDRLKRSEGKKLEVYISRHKRRRTPLSCRVIRTSYAKGFYCVALNHEPGRWESRVGGVGV